jgi:uncharacterized protein
MAPSQPQNYRAAIAQYIREQARPPDKFSHQPRLYALAVQLGQGQAFDDDVLYAAAWMHDLGVFHGHRPSDPIELAAWDHTAYAMRVAPEILRSLGFPPDKLTAVVETIRTHLPSARPTSLEGVLLRDADILEQLGAIGISRVLSKVGRDTRYPTHQEAVRALRENARDLPGRLELPMARLLAEPRLAVMSAFLTAFEAESAET